VREALAEGAKRAGRDPAAMMPSPRCCRPSSLRAGGRRSTRCGRGWRSMPGSSRAIPG
jgi:hypothetical protein